MKQNFLSAETAIMIINHVHKLNHVIIYSYFQYFAMTDLSASEIKEQTILHCAFADYIDLVNLSQSELILKKSIEIVLKKLCN